MVMTSNTPAKKVAIIGAGTGLTTALLLDDMGMKVSVFEALDRAGGHINTIEINGHKLEGGAEFIGSKKFYPYVHRLFEYLGVKLDPYMLSSDFDTVTQDPPKEDGSPGDIHHDHVFSPPAFAGGKKHSSHSPLHLGQKLLNLFGFFKQDSIHLDMHTLLTQTWKSLNTLKALIQAGDISPENVKTLEEFNRSLELIGSEENYGEEYLYPLLAAAWGIPIATVKTFCAQYAMHYLRGGTTWYDAPNGLKEYIDKIVAKLPQESLNFNSPIAKVVPVQEKGQPPRYKLQKTDGSWVTDANGQPELYDEVVLTTNAEIMCDQLPEDFSKDIDELKELLSKVTYYNTKIVFHSDMRYASEKDAVVHTIFKDGVAANTACKSWKYQNTPEDPIIFKTWVLEGQEGPDPALCYGDPIHYRHPVMNTNYFNAQEKLRQLEGRNGLSFGGILAGVDDSHNGGLERAAQNAALLGRRYGTLGPHTLLHRLYPDIEKAAIREENRKLNAEVRTEASSATMRV